MELNKEVIEKLESVVIDDTETLHQIEDLCRDIKDTNIIRPIFMVFENNPDIDFGAPGELVRIVEKFYQTPEYEKEIYESVRRKPTEYNLWILNRLMNTFEEEEKATGIELFRAVIDNPDIPEDVKEWAEEYLEEQTE